MHSHHSLNEGDYLSEEIEKIFYETKIVASPDGGSILKSTSKYHTTGDNDIEEEHVNAGKEKISVLLKAFEGYLLAHPDVHK